MSLKLTIDQLGMEQLSRSLAHGSHAIGQDIASGGTAVHQHVAARVVTLLDGKVVVGGDTPDGVNGRGIETFVLFEGAEVLEEFGTPAHDIVASGRALKLPDGSFVTTVHHPGMARRPWINPAVTTAGNRGEATMKAGVDSSA